MLKLKFQYLGSDVKSQLTGKDPIAGTIWVQEEEGTMEDEMVGQHHWLNGYEFEQALEDGEGQGSLVCCCSGSHKELDMTEQLNNSNIYNLFHGGENLNLN